MLLCIMACIVPWSVNTFSEPKSLQWFWFITMYKCIQWMIIVNPNVIARTSCKQHEAEKKFLEQELKLRGKGKGKIPVGHSTAIPSPRPHTTSPLSSHSAPPTAHNSTPTNQNLTSAPTGLTTDAVPLPSRRERALEDLDKEFNRNSFGSEDLITCVNMKLDDGRVSADNKPRLSTEVTAKAGTMVGQCNIL